MIPEPIDNEEIVNKTRVKVPVMPREKKAPRLALILIAIAFVTAVVLAVASA